MSRSLRIIIIVSVTCIALALSGGLLWANTRYAQSQPAEKKFLVPWLSARTFLQYGVNPYGDQAAQRNQLFYYGRTVLEGEDPLKLSLPFPVEILYFPFAAIPDYHLGRGLWMTLNEIALATATIVCLLLTGWKPGKIFLLVLLLFHLLWIYSLYPLHVGSPAPLVVLALLGGVKALRSGKDELAGGLLAALLLAPGAIIVLLVFLTWWICSQRRWRVLGGFMMTVGFFTIVAFILLPEWVLPFLRGLFFSLSHYPGLSTGGLLADWWPAIGFRIGVVLAVGIAILLIIEWRAARGGGERHFLWTISLSLACIPLLDLPTSLDGHLFLFLPLILLYTISAERWQSRRAAIIRGSLLVGLFMLLWLMANNIQTLFLMLPFMLIIGLYWMRWWAVHPPITWLERMHR